MFQMKEQDKTTEQLSKVETSDLPSKEFQVTFINMLNKLGIRMDDHGDKFNKELENIQKNQTKLKGTTIKFKTH